MARRQKKTSAPTSRGIKHGYRSGLEDKTAKQLKAAGKPVEYETDKVKYTWPARQSTYTPDFRIATSSGGFFYVETKGRFTVSDRQKHLLIKEQQPELDIRFVFSNQNAKLYKGSKTTYAQWCVKNGFQFAHKTIPDDWLSE
tara:strand:- start:667 stop:1092 length:426 start_codon:yes stop_codon:yes gene_type:complete